MVFNLLILATLLAGFAPPPSLSPGETKLLQLEEDARIASEKADPKWYTEHLADTWVLVSHREHTTLSKSEALALMVKSAAAASSSTAQSIHVTKDDKKVYVMGKTGVVTYKQNVSSGDAQPPNTKVEYVTDVFSETSQGWVLFYTQEDSTNPEVA
jgi:hypothetical protein